MKLFNIQGKLLVIAPLLAVFTLLLTTSVAHAATFDPTRIIDDGVFYNSSAMTTQQIQDFLNTQVQTCDTNHAGYVGDSGTAYNPPWVCLKDYYEDNTSTYTVSYTYQNTSGVVVNATRTFTRNNAYVYTALTNPTYKNGDYHQGLISMAATIQNIGGTRPANSISAAQIIWNAAQTYGINPQVLLVTLQKENGLIKDTWPAPWQYQQAMGYGCFDYTPCNSQYSGFYNQVISAAWQFRAYANNPNGYNFVPGPGNNVYYSPVTSTCPSPTYSTLNIQNQSTASLYNYTPYQPNAAALAAGYGTGDGCSAYGNRNFWLYFNDWFGSPYNLYTWAIVSQFAYTDSTRTTPVDLGKLGPGQRYYIGLSLQNTGNVTWSKDGANPMNIGTANPRDSASPFCDSTWSNPSPSCNRPAPLHEWSVAPGQIGSFGFWITTPSTPGTYNEIYAPVVEGITWMDNHTVSFPMVVNPPAYTWSLFSKIVYTDSTKQIAVDSANLVAGQHYYDVISIKNTGNILWQKQGANPTKLGTSNPQDRPSSMCEPSWLSCNRPAPLHEWSVAPGQVGSFEFWIKIPASGTYAENFTPFLEGLIWMNSQAAVLTGIVSPATYSWDLISQFAYTDNTKSTPANMGQLTAGGRYYIGFSLKNTGNAIWHQNTTNPVDLGVASTTQVDLQGKYCDTTWPGSSPGCNRPAYLHEFTVAPGQIGSFEFWITAPISGSYNDTYAPLMEGTTWINYRSVSFPSITH